MIDKAGRIVKIVNTKVSFEDISDLQGNVFMMQEGI